MAAEETDPLVNPTADELGVAEILVQFSLSESRYRHQPLLLWGSKRKRSSIAAHPPAVPASTSQPSQVVHQCETPDPAVNVKTSSPSTPLSFSTSESESEDEKPKPSKRKLKIEKLMKQFEVSSELIRTFTSEINKVQLYLDNLMKHNFELKARREFLFRLEGEQRLQNSRSTDFYHLEVPISVYHQPPSQSSQPSGEQKAPFFGSVDGGSVPFGLSIAAVGWEQAPLMEDRVRAAEARQRRMKIYKSKTSNGFCQSKCVSRYN